MSGHHHHHSVDDDSESKTRIVVAITLVTMLVEIYAGLVTNSMGLLADGWHMGTHAAALGITLYAYYYARTEASVKGKRDSVMALGGFASAIVLGLVALYIGYESIDKIVNPTEIQFMEAIVVAIIGLLVNIACANILGIENHHHGHHHDHDHDHDHKEAQRGTWAVVMDSYKEDFDSIVSNFNLLTNPDEIDDLNRRGAYLHVLADALVSVLVILALIIGMFVPSLVILDPLIGILAGIVIAKWSLSLMSESKNQLLGLK
ncbi:MAG: CDF family Co(II)/Ni(II) efflux transporter DmeF [Candidatus Poseidoniales archaeon]|tara:strand:+ start:116 stop:898 length:783 start_codon:yes stop_codon:yes gene_type:complete